MMKLRSEAAGWQLQSAPNTSEVPHIPRGWGYEIYPVHILRLISTICTVQLKMFPMFFVSEEKSFTTNTFCVINKVPHKGEKQLTFIFTFAFVWNVIRFLPPSNSHKWSKEKNSSYLMH